MTLNKSLPFKYLLIFLSIFAHPILTAEFIVPAIQGPVNDHAQMLSRRSEKSISNMLYELKKLKKTEIAILTVQTLAGETIEQASIKTTDQWQLGTASGDNGVLILIAKQERRIRIEVGQGFEGDLTDSDAAEIIFKTMVPLLKVGDPKSAVIAGLYNIIEQIHPDIDPEVFFNEHLNLRYRKATHKRNAKVNFIIVFIIIVLIIIMHRETRKAGFHRTGGFGRRGGGGFGSGGFGGGGGFGSGGFGGGGGGFSGGGASGGW